jgi:transcriptional regulator with XRE-family HTH domain
MASLEKLMKRLKRLRKARNHMTQAELAKRAGLSPGYIARLETGRHDPTLSTLEKLAKALRVKVAKLLE